MLRAGCSKGHRRRPRPLPLAENEARRGHHPSAADRRSPAQRLAVNCCGVMAGVGQRIAALAPRSSHAQESRHLRLRTSLSRTSLRFPGKVIFGRRDRARQMGSEPEVLSHRDLTPAQNAVKRGLLAPKQEISRGGGVIGGAERTRTACQARSRYRTALSRVIRRGNSAIKCR
jgi:hypothetical protein